MAAILSSVVVVDDKVDFPSVSIGFSRFGHNNKLKVNITHSIQKIGNPNYVQLGQIMEHEFGHICGVFDAYGYQSKDDTKDHHYGQHNNPSFTFPSAHIDGTDIK